MPIFTRSFDLLSWLLPVTNHFPRAHRHGFTRRLLDAAFDLREHLEQANLRRGDARRRCLALADEALARLRLYLRLAVRWGWLSAGQYQHVAEMVTEIGRLLGGWQKTTAMPIVPARGPIAPSIGRRRMRGASGMSYSWTSANSSRASTTPSYASA